VGTSGQSVAGRPGFPRLLAAVALDRGGLIRGLEMSRLARSCTDWHQGLEWCARFQTLRAAADGLDDPTDPKDRLLLGLHGMRSEAERPLLKDNDGPGHAHQGPPRRTARRAADRLRPPALGRVGDRPR
jgi:DNA invertase Pin-like site-specific DNA recombinase